MAFDGFFCESVSREMRESINNFRVEKINCRGSSAEFSLYGEKTKKYLYISLSASANFVTVRREPTLPNDMPSAFCLFLRKHLQSSKLRDIASVENERIIKFVFDSPDELGHISEKTLYAEIMGKYSNLVVTSQGKVLGSLYFADLVSYKRAIMPGITYELPPKQDKISARSIGYDEFERICALVSEKRADKFLVETFFCFSPLTAWETVYSACGNGDATVGEAGSEKLYKEVKSLYGLVESGSFTPCAVYDGENGVEFHFAPIHRYGNMEIRRFSSLCELTSVYFGERSEKSLLKERTSDLAKTVNSRIKRIEKKELLHLEELKECKTKDVYRKKGELITSNIYRIKQGDESVVCTDWETGEEVKIPLNTNLTPSKNAELFFKKYRKLASAEKAIIPQIEEGKEEKNYLLSVLDTINRCENAEDAEQIKDELIAGGYIGKKTKHIQRKPCRPFEYTTPGGFIVRVGRNNVMNDSLTKSAGKDDVWFHVKNFSGSHVILYTNGEEPGDEDYTEAARLAALHSSVRDGTNIKVDYTRVKFVRKPAGSKPGYVIYDKYYTAVVDPKNHQ